MASIRFKDVLRGFWPWLHLLGLLAVHLKVLRCKRAARARFCRLRKLSKDLGAASDYDADSARFYGKCLNQTAVGSARPDLWQVRASGFVDGHRGRSTIDCLAWAFCEEHTCFYKHNLARATTAWHTSDCRALFLEIQHDTTKLAGRLHLLALLELNSSCINLLPDALCETSAPPPNSSDRLAVEPT